MDATGLLGPASGNDRACLGPSVGTSAERRRGAEVPRPSLTEISSMKVLTSVNVAYPDEFYRSLHGFNRRPFGELHCLDQIDVDARNVIYLLF
jgi:hypothetical protein